jgi:Cof subfamily protein (haloacid dehalogenase superfamily)
MLSTEKKGWICLDIDGTITDDILTIPKDVLNYLKELHKDNWELVFVTGRTFSLAYTPLKDFNVPYYLVPQNGASIFEMPEKKLISKKYLPIEIFYELEKFLVGTEHDFVLFGGYDQGESCYYRPHLLKREVREYFSRQLTKLACNWKAVDSFRGLEEEAFPYGKIYGEQSDLKKFLPVFEKIPSIKVHLVKDSVHPTFHIIQIMRKDVDKGRAILEIVDKNTLPKFIISAGNDYNDESMLQISDIKIAMPDSPKPLLDLATLISAPVEEMGIIAALKLATLKVKEYD